MSEAKPPKIRVQGLEWVPASELAVNPNNWRTHPEGQRRALQAIVDQVGFADAVLARRDDVGKLVLIDGHLRAETYPHEKLPVLVLDVTEEEAEKLLLTLDPLAAMAEVDIEQLRTLQAAVDLDGAEFMAMRQHLDQELAIAAKRMKEEEAKAEESEGPSAETVRTEFHVLVRAPDEAGQGEILDELSRHGLECRALTVMREDELEREAAPLPALAVGEIEVEVACQVKRSRRVMQIEGQFDLPAAKVSKRSWRIRAPLDEQEWSVGLIVGPSGCGKSTLARKLFGDRVTSGWEWPGDRSIVDGFPKGMSVSEIASLLNRCGFSSPPSWLRPFHALSNGEQFRVNVARTLAESPELAVVDEWTSVVDRQVAQIASAAVARATRETKRRLVAISCHDDVLEWLQPDWVLRPDELSFQWRSLRRRPALELSIRRGSAQDWIAFGPHHYLSHSLAPSAQIFIGWIGERKACFVACLPARVAGGGIWRGHRTVCLPDFQGLGIGGKMATQIAAAFVGAGHRYRSTTSHPGFLASRLKREEWVCVSSPRIGGTNVQAMTRAKTKSHRQLESARAATRLTTTFEYVGPGDGRAAILLNIPKAKER